MAKESPRETFEDQVDWHANYCKYYQRAGGMPEREECAAGLVYDDIAKVAELGETGSALRLPCLRSNHAEAKRRGQPLCECPSHQWKTQEECENEATETQALIKRFEEQIEVVSPLLTRIKTEHKGKDWRGTEPCPVCANPNCQVSHAAYNGHVTVQCETEDCLNFTE